MLQTRLGLQIFCINFGIFNISHLEGLFGMILLVYVSAAVFSCRAHFQIFFPVQIFIQ